MRLLDKLFSEKSDISVMRIMSVISLIAGIILALRGKDSSIVSIFVYSAFAGKATQRYFESKETSPTPNVNRALTTQDSDSSSPAQQTTDKSK